MSVSWRFEVWTHPRLGTSTRVAGWLPYSRAQLIDREDAIVDSWIEVPAARRDLIGELLDIDPANIAASRSRIIRAFRVDTEAAVPAVPDHEFVAADLVWKIREDGTQVAKISGPDLKGSADDARVLAYDYPAQPATARDWVWNGPNLFDNGALENISDEIQSFYITGITIAGTYTVEFDGQITSALTWGSDPDTRRDNLETALEGLSNIIDVEIIGEGTSVDPFEITFVDPGQQDLPTIIVVASTGTPTVTVESTGGFASLEGWTKAYNPITGQTYGAYTSFRVTSPDLGETGLGGSQAAVVMTIPAGSESLFSGPQVMVSVTPGMPIQISVDAECSDASLLWRLVVRDLIGDTESRLGSTDAFSFTTAGVAQTITLDDVRVRPGVDRVLVRLGLVSTPATAFQLKVDNLVIQQGFRGDSPGGIVSTVHDDLSVEHAPRVRLGWFGRSFDATNDTSGTPWAVTDLPYAIRHGMQFGTHLLGGMQDVGVLWDITPDTISSWNLDLYDAANKGSTLDKSVAFLIGQITDGELQHRLPAYTGITAIGEGGVWAEVTDPDLVTAFGPIDGFIDSSDWLDVTTVTEAAGELLSQQIANVLSVKAVSTDTAGPVPFKQANVSDRATFTLGSVSPHTRRIRQVTVTIDGEHWRAEWIASRIFTGEASTQEALRRLLTEWPYRNQISQALKASATASPLAVTAPGAVSSGAFIHLARSSTQSIPVGGAAIAFDAFSQLGHAGYTTVPTPSGEVPIPKAGYWNVAVMAGWDGFTGGGSVWITRERDSAEVTVWPPANDPGVWVAEDGAVFDGVAHAIPCKTGDVLRVYIDADDASAQTLASATVSAYLVDRVDIEVSCPVLGPEVTVSTVDHDSFPGLAVDDDGTILIAYRQGAGHQSSDGITRLRTSTDDGDTWSAPTTIYSDASYAVTSVTLSKLASGRIVCIMPINDSAGNSVLDGCFMMYSDDAGATWSTPTRVTDNFTRESRAEGTLAELANGDWLFSMHGEDTSYAAGQRSTVAVLSSDNGATWTQLGTMADGVADDRYYTAAGLIRVGSQIIGFIRENDQAQAYGPYGGIMWRTVSDDGGVTWSPVAEVTIPDVIIGGRSDPFMRANGDMVIIWRDIQSDSDYPQALFRSTDLGITWEKCTQFGGVPSRGIYGQCGETLEQKLVLTYAIEDANDFTSDAEVYFRREL